MSRINLVAVMRVLLEVDQYGTLMAGYSRREPYFNRNK